MLENSDSMLVLTAALLAGVALGAVFFGGLWWTVRRGAVSSTPIRWFLGSFVVRTATVLAGFYAVGAGQPVRLGVCMLGFLLGRALVLRMTRNGPSALEPSPPHPRGGPPCA